VSRIAGLGRAGHTSGQLPETGGPRRPKCPFRPPAGGRRRASVGLGWGAAGQAVTSGRPGRRCAGPAASLPGRAPRAAVVGGAPAADRQARDELRGQQPRDASQVQLLPQQGLELPATALGTTKGRLAPPGVRGGKAGQRGPAAPRWSPSSRLSRPGVLVRVTLHLRDREARRQRKLACLSPSD
jgi:hypothetical protein